MQSALTLPKRPKEHAKKIKLIQQINNLLGIIITNGTSNIKIIKEMVKITIMQRPHSKIINLLIMNVLMIMTTKLKLQTNNFSSKMIALRDNNKKSKIVLMKNNNTPITLVCITYSMHGKSIQSGQIKVVKQYIASCTIHHSNHRVHFLHLSTQLIYG